MIFIGIRDDLDIGPGHPKGEGRPICIAAATKGRIPMTFTGDDISKNFVYGTATSRRDPRRPFGTLSGRMNRHGIHPDGGRYFSIEEIQRGGSFPDRFRFIGSPTDRTMRIGNSVPPLFMRAIARHVRGLIASPGACLRAGYGAG